MFRKIEGHWPRQEHFQHYMHNVRCTYSLTVQVDITSMRSALKRNNLKAYPAQIYMLATIVNRLPAFRMGMSAAGEPGYWENLHTSYTVWNTHTGTFSTIWTFYDSDFQVFYQNCLENTAKYGKSAAFAPKAEMPLNHFNVSSVPWVDFTAFNLNVYTEGTYLAPIFTLGKYIEQDGKTCLPLAMQLHHAACDGYHAGQFVAAFREMANDAERWM